MYTNLKNVQIIISLLKQAGVRHLVLSPGTRNAPLAHSVETDPDFICHSMVDERSAAYFALGLAETLGEPVGVSCTSSTATCNYMPALIEAHARNIPLLALTADRSHFKLFQMEDQMIDQERMYGSYVRFYADLPEVKNSDDVWLCERKANEALLALEDGPVQINYQIGQLGHFTVAKLPRCRRISRFRGESIKDACAQARKELLAKRRVLVLWGQDYPRDERVVERLREFGRKFNCAIAVDCFSNNRDDDFVDVTMVTESMTPDEFERFMPDLVITFGKHVWSFIKYRLREKGGRFEHWRVDPEGEISDGLRSLTKVFACGAGEFLGWMNDYESASDHSYDRLWKERVRSCMIPELGFTNFSVIRELVQRLPENALVHATILNATRITSFSKPRPDILCFSNLGADGIDGGLSSFLGESSGSPDRPAFLISGDLSFLYDANVLVGGLKPNQKIFVVNNFAGSEFHTNFGLAAIPTLDRHIAASHKSRLHGLAAMAGARHLAASNPAEFQAGLDEFLKTTDQAVIFEVFTVADTDAKVLKNFYETNRRKTLKKIIRGALGAVKRKAEQQLSWLRREMP